MLRECKKYKLPWYQCPQLIFLLFGVLTVLTLLIGYSLITKILKDPLISAFLITLAGGFLLVLAFIATKSLEILALASKMKSDFMHIFSHQIKTPLTNLAFQLDFLNLKIKERGLEKESLKTFLSAFKENLEKIKKLTEKISLAAKIEDLELIKPQKEYIDLKKTLQETINLYQPLAQKNKLKLSLLFATNLPSQIKTDSFHFKNIVENLVENAVKYGKSQAKVVVYKKGNSLTIEVINDGEPIPKQERSLIFKKFYRGEKAKSTSGTGLGLFIVKSAAELLGGKVTFSSDDNLIKFKVILPLEK